MGHCHFMAWHTLRDALKMTGRSRSQFYRDMRAGLVSYRTGRDGRREFETSELIRAYGELKQNETPERHSEGHAENPHDQQTEPDRFFIPLFKKNSLIRFDGTQ